MSVKPTVSHDAKLCTLEAGVDRTCENEEDEEGMEVMGETDTNKRGPPNSPK